MHRALTMPPKTVNGFCGALDAFFDSLSAGVFGSAGFDSEPAFFLAEQHDGVAGFVGATATLQQADGAPDRAQQQRPLLRSASLHPHAETGPVVQPNVEIGIPNAAEA